jgi:hypothetical protein
MGALRNAHKILVGSLKGKTCRRTVHGWEDNIKIDVNKSDGGDELNSFG